MADTGSMLSKALQIAAITLVFIFGILLGRIYRITSQLVAPLTIRQDHRSRIPVVRIDGVVDGRLTGIARGDVRLLVGTVPVIPTASGSFRVPVGSQFQVDAGPRVPSGMQFVASKRGKKFYPVASKSVRNLSVANRVYFKDAAAAEAAGFVPSR